MSGVLYIVATPIGNLDDISRRAIQVLESVTAIAAEDTRHSKRMLDHFGIRTRVFSCHEHNERTRVKEVLKRLEAGEDIALISDAGTPLISDPGYQLVRAAREAGAVVVPVPGASSIVAALSAAGLPTDRFYYCGFLPNKPAECLSALRALRQIPGTLIMLESRHRIVRLVTQLAEVFPRHICAIAKELTKLHERFMTGSANELLLWLRSDEQLQKGEFVVMIDNGDRHREDDSNEVTDALLHDLLKHVSVKVAVDIASRATGDRKNSLYTRALQYQDEMESG